MQGPLWSRFASIVAVSWLFVGLLTVALTFVASVVFLPHWLACAGLAAHIIGLLIPLRIPPPRWAQRFLYYVVEESRRFFPISVDFEDKDAFSASGPFIVGYEPHSVLPIGACVFMRYAKGMPPCLTNSVMAATSTVFLAAYMRHLVYWLGARSASREVLQRALASGTTVVLCPGGVQECFFMETDPEKETVFLTRRTGFVRLALETGTSIVPVFAFGQSQHYSFFRPFIDWPKRVIPAGAMGSFVRRTGFVPLIAFGWLGTAMPKQVPMHIVVGKPIAVPCKASPSEAEVQQYLRQYIDALVGIFERHKAAAGHPRATLTII